MHGYIRIWPGNEDVEIIEGEVWIDLANPALTAATIHLHHNNTRTQFQFPVCFANPHLFPVTRI